MRVVISVPNRKCVKICNNDVIHNDISGVTLPITSQTDYYIRRPHTGPGMSSYNI